VPNLDLSKIIKAYDIRGLVDTEFTESLVSDVGKAMVEVLRIRKSDGGPGAVVMGRDMRPSGVKFAKAMTDAVISAGVDVVDIGLASTDQLYFASGSLDLPGIMLTASHNPASYNGIKLCKAGAAPVGESTGLAEISKLIQTSIPQVVTQPGKLTHRDLLQDYARYLRALAGISSVRPLKIVVDAGNGMAGHTAPAVLDIEGLEVIPMYFELDGNFPNHDANPIDPKNLIDLQQAVLTHNADLGMAFDGDADRCFLVDNLGKLVPPSALTALIAASELQKFPGSAIVHNLICSKAVPEVISECGGTAIRTRVGHSFIKQVMAETNAVFGGEHSGHFYFREFWRADSGMLAALYALVALDNSAGKTFAQLLTNFDRYPQSGEINSEVPNVQEAILRVRADMLANHEFDELDGLTITAPTWWVNVRPSNTEPLVRLNAEADDAATLNEVVTQALTAIRDFE
jgi:phosphomannomutase